ncbi:ArnT family glycosyltransferase [Roseiconus lacunae]|uniref:ArnT family glycosyltransferase n=1 Tax=Roseiconus lacunae TaxID=2605694 RepID=UPI001E2BE13D|nr:glycosyltransferase family 39 protein [Roseiconus lacunae]MCD0459994.1 glycosyltransferase family 39 protein [Roseiconus lacunae]
MRSEVLVGRQLVKLNGRGVYRDFFIARLAVIPISIVGAFLSYFFAKQLFGTLPALLTLAIWCFSPSTLAYGSLITPDLSSAVAFLATCFAIYHWLLLPNTVSTAILSSALAIALLTKSVWLILVPLLPLIWTTLILWGCLRKNAGRNCKLDRTWQPLAIQSGLNLLIAILVAVFAVNAFYGFQQSLKPLGEYRFLSAKLSGNPIPTQDAGDKVCLECPVDRMTNRFSSTFMSGFPIPLPSRYVEGIDLQLRDFERGWYDPKWQSYLLGTWKQGGWWYYYLLAIFFKTPAVTWLLFAMSLFAFPQMSWSGKVRTAMSITLPAIAFLIMASSAMGINRYFRYALPVLPFLFIWCGLSGKLIAECSGPVRQRIAGCLLLTSVVYMSYTAWHFAPHHLSYFNEIVGGPSSGHKFLCDSNVDWGQDLVALENWLELNPQAKKNLHLAYFGSYDPSWVGIEYDSNVFASLHEQDGKELPEGWYVISKNFLVGHSMPIPTSSSKLRFDRFPEDTFAKFVELTPSHHIGYSMFVYHIETKRRHQEVKLVKQ